MASYETKTLIAALLASGILAVILLYFFITTLRQKRRHDKLQLQMMEAEIKSKEAERNRIASDLHDDLGPIISAVKLQISSISITDPDDLETIRKCDEQIDAILQRLREIANDLMPAVLMRKGLIYAIQEFINQLSLITSENIQFFCASTHLGLNKDAEIHLFRIIKELIHNALKHAHASMIQVRIEKNDLKIFIEIVDNGKGFILENVRQDGVGIGLTTVTSRVEIMGGEVFIETMPGRGCRFNIEIPKI